MKRKNKKGGLPPEVVSATELTGAMQRITPTPEQLKKYHKEFNKDK